MFISIFSNFELYLFKTQFMSKYKNTLTTSLLILFNLIIICLTAGGISKLNHLPNGALLILSGLGLFVFLFIPLLIRLLKKATIRFHTRNLLLIIFSCIAVFVVFGALKVYHATIYPNISGISLILIPVICLLFLHKAVSISEKSKPTDANLS